MTDSIIECDDSAVNTMIKIVRPTQKHIYTMALAAGFEPANLFRLPVFKTGGLNRTLPSKHIKVVATKLRMATQNITTMFLILE